MKAVLIAVGDELLDGRTIDSNSAFVAAGLLEIGIPVRRCMVVPDAKGELLADLREALRVADVLILTGGLGPTEDDRTRDVLADLAGCELCFDEAAWRSIQGFFTELGREAPESNRRQAFLPEGAELLPNPVGTAPGIALEVSGTRVFSLPGVPSEMRRMFECEVRPRVVEFGVPTVQRTLAFAGVSESQLGGLIGDLAADGREVRVGITAKWGLIRVTLQASGASREEAASKIEPVAAEIRSLGERWFLREGRQELHEILGEHLIANGISISLAESCTAGMAVSRLGGIPGISAVLDRSFVTYSDRAKRELLGVPEALLAEHGAVSEEVVSAMVAGLADRTGARLCAAISGIAGPDGGSPEKPVGTVLLAVRFDGSTQVLRRQYGQRGRSIVQNRAVHDLWVQCLIALGLR